MKATTVGIMILVGLFFETQTTFAQAVVWLCDLDFVLMDECVDGNPLPDGTSVRIYWDANSNGPDPSDVMPPTGDCPACLVFNMFPLNGEVEFGIPGTFCGETGFGFGAGYPLPWRFFLRVLVCDNDIMWTTPSFTVVEGLQEIDVSIWVCEPCAVIDDAPEATFPVVDVAILHPNYPNPFNPSTKITFDLPHQMSASLKVYDVLGREVAELINGSMNAGAHTVMFDASALSSGVYFYRLDAGAFVETRKMVVKK